jgi:DNA-binding response OmpR family regulator
VILTIDDDPDLSSMLGVSLSMSGYTIIVANDGATGMSMAETEQPDLIVLDVMMPGKTGLEVMRELRNNPSTSAIPLLFLSGVRDESVVIQGLRGADDYVTKPFRLLELEERIRKILERRTPGEPGTSRAETSPKKLAVQQGEESMLLPLQDIRYLAATGKYTYTFTDDRRYLVGSSISELEQRLFTSGNFIRVHRSYVVNLDHVARLKLDDKKKLNLVMDDAHATEIRVSDSYLSAVKNAIVI